MDAQSIKSCNQSEKEMELRRGPWTVEEDFTLINCIALHGEGRWNSLARSAGLKRTGKSCRLRWLNYLRPDVRHGNITLEEQLLILELHSRWGNRWSKIAQYLPGRTDNEIKNYWRTRVQKHAKQLNCDVNSKQFKDTMRYLWMPMLIERIQASNSVGAARATTTVTDNADNHNMEMMSEEQVVISPAKNCGNFEGIEFNSSSFTPQNSLTSASSDSFGSQVFDPTDSRYKYPANYQNHDQGYNYEQSNRATCGYEDPLSTPSCYFFFNGFDFEAVEQNNQLMDGEDSSYNLWNAEDYWYLDNQLINNL